MGTIAVTVIAGPLNYVGVNPTVKNCNVPQSSPQPPRRSPNGRGGRRLKPLRAEFERRLQHLQQAGETPDPKAAQIERLKTEVDKLKTNLAQANSTIQDLTDFRSQALARLAAQHDEILQLRAANDPAAVITRLPKRPKSQQKVIGPC
jgi:septal ring factor EnvC (AmiA/AmiB activator)